MRAPWRRPAAVLVAAWGGVLAALGVLVAPALFGALPSAQAGAIAGGLFEKEASGSLAVALAVLVAERLRPRGDDPARPAFSVEFGLALGVVFCTVAGYYAVQPMMEAARAGQGRLSFGALHAISGGFFVLRGLLLAMLAWRLTRAPAATEP